MSKKHNSTYTIIFVTVVSLIFALLLAIVASTLQGKIGENEKAAVLGKILASFGNESFEAELKGYNKETVSKLSNKEVTELFNKRIQVRLVGISKDAQVKTIDLSKEPNFDVTKYVPWENLADVAAKALTGASEAEQVAMLKDVQLPLYCLKNAEGTVVSYTIPVWGKGLWGPIYGYIALEKDGKTIKGATFSAPKETPGLGLEIENEPFRNNWPGKRIFNDGKLTPIEVTKAGAAEAKDIDKVDGVSGATLTCRGVTGMMESSLSYYENYLKTLSQGGE